MRDFLDQLDDALVSIAPHENAARRPRARPAKLAGVAAILATAGAAFTMTGTSVAGLAILDTPTTDVTQIRDAVPEVAEAGVDFSKAHVFGTAGGPGYALVNEETDTVCLVAPDAQSPGDYGSSCKRPIDMIEREGMSLQIVRDTAGLPGATSTTIVLLPEDATDVELRSAGRTITPEIDAGVAAFELQTDGTLQWTVDGRRFEQVYLGPFKTVGSSFSCPDGRTAVGPAPPPELSGRAVQKFLRSAQEEACGA